MPCDAKQIADYLLDCLSEGLASKGRACLVVSGGSSPVPVFTELSKRDFAWDKVSVTLVDERAVPQSHKDSNHRLISETLLVDKASAAHFIPLYDNANAFEMITSPDVVLLGMGTDGHFASLFPDMINLSEAFDPNAEPAIITTGPMGNPVHPRISMNMSMIQQIPHICLMLPNDEKRALFEAAKTDNHLPIHYLQKTLQDRLVLFS